MEYIIDLKVYNPIPQEELGIIVPLEILQNGKIPKGIHQIILETTEALLDQFQEKTFENPDVKVLGVHHLAS